MINPVGSARLNPLYVSDDAQRNALIDEAQSLPSLRLSSATAANAVMLGAGYFSPFTGFMNLADALGVARNMKTTSGQFFPVPILNLVDSTESFGSASRIALRDPNVDGNPVIAIQQIQAIETVSDAQMALMTEKVYATTDPDHPGAAAVNVHG
ncbi:MAG: sulfate adenylyltransferase, partial [Proteobacteria bacterium]|nr:sulfate adenylyltransferase [Pseudomonadota bacterium]